MTVGAGEGNRTLVVSLGSWLRNGLTMRPRKRSSLHKADKLYHLQPSIHLASRRFVEQISPFFATICASHSDCQLQYWPCAKRLIRMIPLLPNDQRRAERRIVRVRAILSLPGLGPRYEVRTENVSDDGIAVRMPIPLKTGTLVDITFTLASGQGPVNLTLTAKVVHTLLSGHSWLTGLFITAISAEDKNTLSAYCCGHI
jgi:hypothetical protein